MVSDQLNKYIQTQCSGLMNRLKAHPNKYKLALTVRPEAKNKEGKVKSFTVKGVIKIARASDIRAAKKDANPKVAVDDVIKALEKQIRRSTEKKERSRKTLGKTLKPIKEYKYELSVK
jgi:ribosome-associated translation inhibitor RaiA